MCRKYLKMETQKTDIKSHSHWQSGYQQAKMLSKEFAISLWILRICGFTHESNRKNAFYYLSLVYNILMIAFQISYVILFTLKRVLDYPHGDFTTISISYNVYFYSRLFAYIISIAYLSRKGEFDIYNMTKRRCLPCLNWFLIHCVWLVYVLPSLLLMGDAVNLEYTVQNISCNSFSQKLENASVISLDNTSIIPYNTHTYRLFCHAYPVIAFISDACSGFAVASVLLYISLKFLIYSKRFQILYSDLEHTLLNNFNTTTLKTQREGFNRLVDEVKNFNHVFRYLIFIQLVNTLLHACFQGYLLMTAIYSEYTNWYRSAVIEAFLQLAFIFYSHVNVADKVSWVL